MVNKGKKKQNQIKLLPNIKDIFTVISIIYGLLICALFYKLGHLDFEKFVNFSLDFVIGIGAILVSIVAVRQAEYYNAQENQRRADEREEQIKPIFSVKIIQDIAKQVDVPCNCPNNDYSNIFGLRIKNVGEYPAFNVIIWDEYKFHVWGTNETKNIYGSFDGKLYRDNSKIICVADCYGEVANGLPQWLQINYIDVDGNGYFQRFEQENSFGNWCYCLCKCESTL